MTYKQALAALDARQETRIELGLERVRHRLARLGDPQKKLRCFHVAGTNGKGSVCAMLAASLQAAGYKTGLYTSPHLADVRERIKIQGRPIGKEDFADALGEVLKTDAGRKLTYFELLTITAFVYFAAQSCDAVVLETGLGGRLDATNVIERPLAAVITSLDFDHMSFLGKTLPAIAKEKAGIAKKGAALIAPSSLAPSAMRVIQQTARNVRSPLVIVDKPWKAVSIDWRKGVQTMKRPDGKTFQLSLLGDKQGMNAALAYAALRAASREFPVTDAALSRGLRRVACPCRFEVVRLGAKTAIIDGAHNAEAAAHLARTWRASPWAGRPARWIVGLLRDKDVRAVLGALGPLMGDVVAVSPPSPRALDAAGLARLLRPAKPGGRVAVEPDAETALRRWRRESSAPRTAVVCGSFYLAARASEVLHG